jgi:TPR repeat protein
MGTNKMGEVKSLQQEPAPSGDWFEAVILSKSEGIGTNEVNRDRFNEFFGEFMAKSYASAYAGFAELAETGSSVCQYYLGIMSLNGKGVLQDFCQAHMWLNIASSRGHEKARKQLGQLTQVMTPEQVADAQRQARQWVIKQVGGEEHTATDSAGLNESGTRQEPEVVFPQDRPEKLPWVKLARELADSIKRDHPKRGQLEISKQVHALMLERRITGRGGRVPSPGIIKREALKGL